MVKSKSAQRGLAALTLVVSCVLLLTTPVFAYLYRAPFTVTESDGNTHTALTVNHTMNTTWFIDNGFITTATALDTRIETLGGVAQPHMVAEDRVLTFLTSLDASSQTNWYLTTGNTALSSFPIIVGEGGYITTADHANLELGNNFSIEFDGYVTASGGSSGIYPVVESYNTSYENGLVANHTVSLPSGVASGDLLLLLFAGGYYDQEITWPSGWTELDQQKSSSESMMSGAAYKVADGSEGATVICQTSGTALSAHQVFRLSNYSGVPEMSTYHFSYTGPNPPSLTNSWGSTYGTLWIAWMGGEDNCPSAYPSNYSDTLYVEDPPTSYAGVASARRELMAETEDPGAFTPEGGLEYVYAWTIAVQGPSSGAYVNKKSAFCIYETGGEVKALIASASSKEVTATGLTAGEYTVEVWADGTDLGIDIDGVTQNTTALSGASVPNNANSWVLTPTYFNYYAHQVSGTNRTRYEPSAMISGTTLPNSLNPGTYDGTITWGSNPAGVSTALGGLTSSSQPSVGTGTGDEASSDILLPVEVSDWFEEPDLSGRLLNHPLRPIVTIMSNGTSATELQAWRFLGLAIILLVLVGTAIAVRGHFLISGLACAGCIGVIVYQTIWPLWALIFIIPAIVGGAIAERTPSL